MLAIQNPDLIAEDNKLKIQAEIKQISNKYTVLAHTF
jgi:hypothetical protein